MVSATWNLEIADELGNAFAEEAWLFKQEDGQPVTGLYGYGLNTHRSALAAVTSSITPRTRSWPVSSPPPRLPPPLKRA